VSIGDYYRSRDGRTVHRAGCPSLSVANSRAVRWQYANDMTFVGVLECIADHDWLTACKRCMKPRVTP
jgi:hypothetical protein